MIYLVTNEPPLIDSSIYKLISVEESLRLLEPLTIVGLDTETDGLDCWLNKLKSLQLGCEEFQIVIDTLTVPITQYKEYLESNRLFIGWNLKFDLKFLYRNNIWPNNVFDGFLAEKLLWHGYPAGIHSMSLKSAGQNYLNIELDKSVRGKIIWAGLTEDVIEYSANDVKYLEQIMNLQIEELKKKNLQIAIKYENAFVLPLAYMEYCGIKLDKEKWLTKMKKDQDRADNAKSQLDQWLIKNMPNSKYVQRVTQGDLFNGFAEGPQVLLNWNSTQQLIPIFQSLGVDCTSKDKDQKLTLDAKVLKPQKDISELIPIYLDYKEATKVTSTYGENFLQQINSVSGRIHTSYQQLGANTTRITSGGKDRGNNVEYVNLLNLPSDAETRSCFVAEDGNRWISIDYAGQETFLMASIANDEAIIKELMEGSGDIHSLTAYIAYPEIPRDTDIKDIKKLYHDYRQDAKGIEFSINYGGNARTISQNKGIPMEEAQKIYDNYMEGFRGLAKYQAFRRKDWFEKGYILLNEKTGHKAFIHDWENLKNYSKKFDSEFWSYYKEMKVDAPSCDTVINTKEYFKSKSNYERASINYPIQATGSMCLRVSLINFFQYIKENNLQDKVKICVAPYDEINCEAPENIAQEVAEKLYQCMVNAGEYFCTKCKLDADISYQKDGTLPNYWIH